MTQRRIKLLGVLAGVLALIGCTQLKQQPSTQFSPTPAPSASVEEETDASPVPFPSESPSPSTGPSPSPSADVNDPSVAFTSPTTSADFNATTVNIAFEVTLGEGRKVASAELYYDDRLLATFNQPAATYRLDGWNPNVASSSKGDNAPVKFGAHRLRVEVKDDHDATDDAELSFYKPLRLGAWEAIDGLPAPLAHAAAFSDGASPAGTMLPWGIATDTLDPATVTTSAYGFSPEGDGSWTTVALTGASTPRAAYGSAVHPSIAGQVYMVGGRNGATDLRSVEIFSPLIKKAEPSLASMATARMKPAVVIHDNYLYAIGGQGGTQALASTERVKLESGGAPTSTFEARAGTLHPRVAAHAIGVGKEIWLIGGGYKPIEVYSPAKNEWTYLTNAAGATVGTPETWADSLMIQVGDRYCFFGGLKEDGQPITRIYELTPATKTWRVLGELPVPADADDLDRPVAGMAGCYENGYFYLMGGIPRADGPISRKAFRAQAL